MQAGYLRTWLNIKNKETVQFLKLIQVKAVVELKESG